MRCFCLNPTLSWLARSSMKPVAFEKSARQDHVVGDHWSRSFRPVAVQLLGLNFLIAFSTANLTWHKLATHVLFILKSLLTPMQRTWHKHDLKECPFCGMNDMSRRYWMYRDLISRSVPCDHSWVVSAHVESLGTLMSWDCKQEIDQICVLRMSKDWQPQPSPCQQLPNLSPGLC